MIFLSIVHTRNKGFDKIEYPWRRKNFWAFHICIILTLHQCQKSKHMKNFIFKSFTLLLAISAIVLAGSCAGHDEGGEHEKEHR